MSNDAVNDAGKRFGRDMRRIRKERDVSVNTVHENTRIAHTLIETFEEDGLLDHPAFNRVYLRSFVRSYAEAVELPEEVALEALDQALEGEYTNQLAAYALDEDPESPPVAEPEPGEETDADEDTARESTPPDEPGPGERSGSKEATVGTEADSSRAPSSREGAREHPRMVPEGTSSSTSSGSSARSSEPTASHKEASESRSESTTTSSGVSRFSLSSSFRKPAFIILIVLIALILLGVGAWWVFQGQTSPGPGAADTSVSESGDSLVQAGLSPSRPPANVTLGETLHLTILADADVRGIRLRRDDDLRRPYWIDSNEATVFPFRNRVIIEQELGNVRLLLEGYPYPLTQAHKDQGRVVITRDTAAAFVDTLRGRPVSFDSPPDTNHIPAFAQ